MNDDRKNFRCPKCKKQKNIGVMVDVTISIPVEKYRRLSKRDFRSKETILWGASWDKADFVCQNCNYAGHLESFFENLLPKEGEQK